MRTINTLAALALLAGCGPTLQEIRALPPAAERTVSGSYRDVAQCVADWLTHAVEVTERVREQEGRATLTGVSSFGPARMPLWEIELVGLGDTTRATLRQRPSVWGVGPVGWFEDALDRCRSA
ncbi:hypothetical protein [Elioraea sp.]|uniref:hypothetical protein n=1 Tax=Elioraea sp. TaxID=2185103 RepID=UPI0021DDBEFA|nr:hypothetical protein [Elioraea sp.]GIX12035.1 MAG: hypothetical protein KatS3mg116_3745 [Elioraea sp.]